MKISRFSFLFYVILTMAFCVSTPNIHAQAAGQKTKTIEAAKSFAKRLESEKVQKAVAKRKPFLKAGGFMGFVFWVLMFLNAILFVFTASFTWSFIRRHRTYPRELVHRVNSVLHDGELGFAMEACAPCKTPLSRILFSAFKNIADGFEVCKDEMNIAIKAEHERMLKSARALLNCAVYSFVLGLLGFAMVLILALKDFATNSNICHWQQLAYSAAQSFYPLLTGLIIACIAFWFYQYCIGKINRIIINTEKIAYDLIKILRGINLDDEVPEFATMTRLLDPKSFNK